MGAVKKVAKRKPAKPTLSRRPTVKKKKTGQTPLKSALKSALKTKASKLKQAAKRKSVQPTKNKRVANSKRRYRVAPKPLKSSFMKKKRNRRLPVRRVSWSPDVSQIERKPSRKMTGKRKSTVFYKINSDKTVFEDGVLYASPLNAKQCMLKLCQKKQVLLYIIVDYQHKSINKMKTKSFRIVNVPGATNHARIYFRLGDIQYEDPFMNLLWLNGKKHDMNFAYA